MTTLTKRQLRDALGFETDAAVAGFFGISAAAVSQWDDDKPIPQLRFLQALSKRPDLVALNGATQGAQA